jgi:RimJ/RimL family protein N-acetyltransferase
MTTLRTSRLVLRPPESGDAARICLLAGDYDVARMTATIPHPYGEQQAAAWIESVQAGEEGVVLAVLRAATLIGCAGYRAFGQDHAELGYWIGKPYWGMGYATEAVGALIAHAFEAERFVFLAAGHFTDNPASARVIEKLGFVSVGGEVRDCEARGAKVPCRNYRLYREARPLRA